MYPIYCWYLFIMSAIPEYQPLWIRYSSIIGAIEASFPNSNYSTSTIHSPLILSPLLSLLFPACTTLRPNCWTTAADQRIPGQRLANVNVFAVASHGEVYDWRVWDRFQMESFGQGWQVEPCGIAKLLARHRLTKPLPPGMKSTLSSE